jgi:hypothetical protein
MPGHVCNAPWHLVQNKLDVLSAYSERNNISTALILDGTGKTYSAVGGAGNVVFNNQYLTYCASSKTCVGALTFAGGHWAEVTKEAAVYTALRQLGDAANSGDFRGTAVDPGVACAGTDKLFQIPCQPSLENCNAVAAEVFGMNVAKNETVNDVLPARPVVMNIGSVWRLVNESNRTCRKIVSSWSNSSVACSGDSLLCWKGIQNGKSKVVDCEAVYFVDKCGALDLKSGQVDLRWTCCEHPGGNAATADWLNVASMAREQGQSSMRSILEQDRHSVQQQR